MAKFCIYDQSKEVSNILTVEIEVSEIPFNHLGNFWQFSFLIRRDVWCLVHHDYQIFKTHYLLSSVAPYKDGPIDELI